MSNLINIPLIDKRDMSLDGLEADLAVANARVAQAIRRRDDLLDQMEPLAKESAIEDLQKRGIYLGRTIVRVSFRHWGDEEWHYRDVFVMDVTVSTTRHWFTTNELLDPGSKSIKIDYTYALVRKNKTPSKSPLGFWPCRANIERVIETVDHTP